MNYLLNAWKKALDYTSRASRKEYWMTVLWHVILVVVVATVAIMLRIPMGLSEFVQDVVLAWSSYILIILLVLYVIWSTFVFLALGVRRLHDIGMTGLWMLICLVPFGGLVIFVFALMPGNIGDNKYGADPTGRVAMAAPSQAPTGSV